MSEKRVEEARFGDSGAIQGVLGESMGPEMLMTLGGVLGAEKKVGIGCSQTPGARMLARAAAVGVAAVGGDAVAHSLDSPVQGAGVGVMLDLPVSLFVEEQGGEVYLHIFDQNGLAPDPERREKLEKTLRRGGLPLARSGRVGQLMSGELSSRDWGLWVARRAGLSRPALRRLTVAVGRETAEDRAVREALASLGCILEEQWRPGIPAFRGEKGAFGWWLRTKRAFWWTTDSFLPLRCSLKWKMVKEKRRCPPEPAQRLNWWPPDMGGRSCAWTGMAGRHGSCVPLSPGCVRGLQRQCGSVPEWACPGRNWRAWLPKHPDFRLGAERCL